MDGKNHRAMQQQSSMRDEAEGEVMISARDAMPEDDPNGNVNPEGVFKPLWGPHHSGAKKLAALYSRGKERRGEEKNYFQFYLQFNFVATTKLDILFISIKHLTN